MTEAKVLLALPARSYSLQLEEPAVTPTGSASDREAAGSSGPEFAVALGNVLLQHAAVRVHKLEDTRVQPAAV